MHSNARGEKDGAKKRACPAGEGRIDPRRAVGAGRNQHRFSLRDCWARNEGRRGGPLLRSNRPVRVDRRFGRAYKKSPNITNAVQTTAVSLLLLERAADVPSSHTHPILPQLVTHETITACRLQFPEMDASSIQCQEPSGR